jgi:uncharacterized membrane protein
VIVCALLFLGEPMSAMKIVGGALISAGAVVLAFA